MNKSGFTLIEILVVVIIIGILATLALPPYTKTIEFVRALEAYQSIAAIRGAILHCGYFNNNNLSGYDDFSKLDIKDPATAVGAHFSYSINILNPTPADQAFSITATRNSLNGGNVGDKITITLTTAGVSKSGTGAFSPIR